MKHLPELYMIFARKNAQILHDNCPNNIFPDFLGEARHVPLCPRLLCLWNHRQMNITKETNNLA